jgi:uncharacterized protein YabN with tetrapyrrole methylase and pyrophosphatase domain
LGDLLFSVVNLSRFLDARPREELLGATRRFEERWERVRRAVEASGRDVADCALEELDAVWDRVKEAERPRGRQDGAPGC